MMIKQKFGAVTLALLGSLGATPSHAGADPFVGQVMCGGFNFAPSGWMEMAGQTLSIAEYEVLFQLIGTTWGGDGQTTFRLPDLRGRAIMGTGQGPGLSPRNLGDVEGTESETLAGSQLPAHNHAFAPAASTNDATAKTPAGNVAATKARTLLYAPGPGDVAMQASQSGSIGSGQPISNMQPYLPMKCLIAVFGIFPSQN